MKIRKDEINRLPQITEGGEGIIYEYHGDVLKVYKSCVNTASKEKKITMLIQKSLPKEVVKPMEAVYNSSGKFIGFTMKRVSGEELKALTNRKHLKANGISTRDILKILVKVQEVVAAVHKAGVYIGDLNDKNILFDAQGNVFFIDCDSWSIGDEKCDVVMDLYRDPLMKSNEFSESTDMYALCILIWRILTRIHPHSGTMTPDMDILERMEKGISVIDNPKVKIPRTIKSWRNLSPALVESLKKVFENKSRIIKGELADMAANLKYCDRDQEYYYGKFNRCPLCDDKASVISKPISQGVMGGLTLVAMLKADDIGVVLNESCYLDKNGNVVNIQTMNKLSYQKGRFYHFLNNGLLIMADSGRFYFTANRHYAVLKAHNSPIYTEGREIYYMTPHNTFTKMVVTDDGNGVSAIAKCSYDTYFAVNDGHYCLVNRYDGKLIINCDGRNIEIPYQDQIVNYGIHRDVTGGNWLAVLENGSGLFKTLVIGKEVEYETEQIKYTGGLGNLCISNDTIYIPIDGKIRGYSYRKQAFKDFECGIVTPDSRLIKNGPAFTIVNDENIYRLGR